ncbi:hypothetical protein B0I72DRAFT_7217 [Yarrowia lipolytica]|nr:hypothetical protein B0I72DRAFT_7217 [Yarrowia lipolytica]
MFFFRLLVTCIAVSVGLATSTNKSTIYTLKTSTYCTSKCGGQQQGTKATPPTCTDGRESFMEFLMLYIPSSIQQVVRRRPVTTGEWGAEEL